MSSADHSQDILLKDLAATNDLADRLSLLAKPGDVICLKGDLGAGKTAFARAFVRALTAPDEDVPSPTFTLVQVYETEDFELFHADLYRLENPEDALELGLEDAFYDGVSLIEWPDRLGALLPRERLDVTFRRLDDEAREVLLEAFGGGWDERLREHGHG